MVYFGKVSVGDKFDVTSFMFFKKMFCNVLSFYYFCYCPKHCLRLIEGQQSAGVGVKISWVKQLFVILPESRLEPLSLGMGTWNAASKELIFYKNVKKKLTKET